MKCNDSIGRGFTLLELLVVLAILAILAGILVPSLLSLREKNNRNVCLANLWQIGAALSAYSKDNHGEYPRVVYDPSRPGYTAWTGPYAPDPFASRSEVKANDVTASLWLLVRGGYIASQYGSSVFVCPSTHDTPDPLLSARGYSSAPKERSNFASPQHLSYSYAMPFGNAAQYRLSADILRYDFVLVADRNPGRRAPQDVTQPLPGDTGAEAAVGNSLNHRRAGQNLLFADMHVEFRSTPYCGQNGDNIYTANVVAPMPTTSATSPTTGAIVPQTLPSAGIIGTGVSPASLSDTFLVPTESD